MHLLLQAYPPRYPGIKSCVISGRSPASIQRHAMAYTEGGPVRAEGRDLAGHLRVVRGGLETRKAPAARAEQGFELGIETDREERRLRIEPAARLRHLYVCGQPGAGKSTLLLNLVRRDLATGTGCCVLDPHGGLVDSILAACRPTPEQARRIVVVDAADNERPVGIDLMSARSEYEQDLVVQFFLGLFSRLYLAEHQGPVFHQAVRNGLLLLMQAERTLAEFPLVFTDKAYLKRLLERCTDPFVRRYFEKMWNGMAEFHRSEQLSYLTSKLAPFYEDRLMRGMLAQRGGLDLDACMAEGRVVLVNLARGRIGDANAALLGQILLHLIRRSAMRRDPSAELSPFHLYIDEAHEFAGRELRELVTAMRKFAVGVTLANQSIDDFAPWVRDTILGSVATFVILRQGAGASPSIEALAGPRFDQRDLMRLPDFTAIAWSGVAADLARPRRVRLSAPPQSRHTELAAEIRRLSAARYGRPRAEVERELLRAADGGEVSEG
jgi:DNA helicase HerA-like ATPase